MSSRAAMNSWDEARRVRERSVLADPEDPTGRRHHHEESRRFGDAMSEDLRALIDVLAYDEEACRMFAVKELEAQLSAAAAGSHSADAALILLRALRDSNPKVRSAAAAAFTRAPQDSAHKADIASALLEASRDRFPEVRHAAAKTLSLLQFPAEIMVEVLSLSLQSEDSLVCGLCAQRLESFGAAARPAIPALYRSIKHKEESYRNLVTKVVASLRAAPEVKKQSPRKSPRKAR
jgi:hypothetical protein